MIDQLVAAFLLATGLGEIAPALQKTPLARAGDCGDFLAAMDRKPPPLRYVGCVYETERQARPLSATYRVRGRDAAAVEAYFGRAIGLQRLKRICCYWGAPEERLRDRRGRNYYLSMASSETVYNTRAVWREIDWFTITVTTDTEEV